MGNQLFCDGCKAVLFVVGEQSLGTSVLEARELTVEGVRANGMCGGGPLPQGQFHWCERCARVAFQAVQDQRLKQAGWVR